MSRPAAAFLVLCVLAGCSGGDDDPEAAPSGASNLLDRVRPAVTVTSHGVFAYGGQDRQTLGEPLPGAALIDVATADQTPLPEPPLDAPLRARAMAATVEDEVLLFGELCEDLIPTDEESLCDPGGPAAALLDLGSRTWRRLDLPDALVEATAGTDRPWTPFLLGTTLDGRVVIDIFLDGQRAAGEAPFWTYRPATDSWVHLADAGVDYDGACLADGQIVVSSSTEIENQVAVDVVVSRLALDGSTVWERGAPLDRRWEDSPFLSCGGGIAVIVGDHHPSPQAYLQRVDDWGQPWERLPDPPDDVYGYDEVWTGEDLVLLGNAQGGTALDPVARTWTRVPLPEWPHDVEPQWTGQDLLVFLPSADGGLMTISVR